MHLQALTALTGTDRSEMTHPLYSNAECCGRQETEQPLNGRWQQAGGSTVSIICSHDADYDKQSTNSCCDEN